jgi:hypothetical protein
MNSLRSVAIVAVVALSFLNITNASAQDVVTVGTVTAHGSTVDVPVSIRDASGTSLGMDRAAGSRIQSFSIKVTYSPAAAVSSVSFSRAGITANLSPKSEFAPASSGSVSLLETFQESTNPIPFALNAPLPGDDVAHLVFTLSPSAAAGSSITLTLDPSLTQLTDEGGTGATKETVANGGLSLVDGAINVAALSLSLSTPITLATGTVATMTVSTSSPVTTNTTIALTSSAPNVAAVPASVVIAAGSQAASFQVSGLAIGSSNITASSGGSTAQSSVEVQEPTACVALPAPQLTANATAVDSGTAYKIGWAAIGGATSYVIDESTDSAFTTVNTSSSVVTGATFAHSTPGVRYYYRVRARNDTSGCSTESASSNVVSVLINGVQPPAVARVLTVVGSVAGGFGSFFKTSVQLYNPKSTAVSGKIVYHAQGTSGAATDPSLSYSILPGKTLVYADLLPALGVASGLGSADLVADVTSALPAALIRVFNDGGIAGTTGFAEEMLASTDALHQGDSAVLIAPSDAQKFRLNIGVRTLTQGAVLALTVRDKDGAVVKSASRSYGATFFTQVAAATLLDGYALVGGETITIAVTSGDAIVYGSTTDNITNDPSVQFARKIE